MKIFSQLALIALVSLPVISQPQANLKSACVTIYTIEGCPYCTKAKDLMKQYNIHYCEEDITNDAAKRDMLIKKYNHKTVPIIVIDNSLVGGADNLKALIESQANQLKPLN